MVFVILTTVAIIIVIVGVSIHNDHKIEEEGELRRLREQERSERERERQREIERLEREKLERERLERERLERERLEKERKERERKEKERKERERQKRILSSPVLDLFFSVEKVQKTDYSHSNYDSYDNLAEIFLSIMNSDGEKIETSLGKYRQVKRKNGSMGFVASDLKKEFKPELLKLLNYAFSSYIQASDRMNFCEVVIDELLTQGFSEQVFTRIENEPQDNSSSGEANVEDESTYYFGILGLRKDASLQDVERSYKEMMKFWHPDQFAGNKKKQAEAEERCKQLNVAYSWLKEYFQA